MNCIVEANVDFFSELNKLNDENEITDNTDNTDTCLLSGEKLGLNYITINCGHTFNYLPLYLEIIKQKISFNPLETTRLNLNEIKCPYCRSVTNKLLPQIHISNTKLIRGVNSPKKYCMSHRKCSWTFKSGKQKNNICGREGYDCKHGSYCTTHRNFIERKLLNQQNTPSICKHEYDKLTVAALRVRLKEKGLKISGIKNELIIRLKNNI